MAKINFQNKVSLLERSSLSVELRMKPGKTTDTRKRDEIGLTSLHTNFEIKKINFAFLRIKLSNSGSRNQRSSESRQKTSRKKVEKILMCVTNYILILMKILHILLFCLHYYVPFFGLMV